MDDLRDAMEFTDLQGMIEEYVETKYSGEDEVIIQECPKCLNDKWKLYVNVEKKIWFCQRCQWGKRNGDFCSLLSALSGKNKMVIIKEILNTIVPSVSSDSYEGKLTTAINNEQEQEAFEIEPIDLPGQLGFEGTVGAAAHKYLLSRGVTSDDMAKYKLRLAHKLRNKAGPWAVFPVTYFGIPVACQGRKFSGDVFPKYMSTDKISNWMWPLSEDNLKNMEEKNLVVLVEGVFDALAFVRSRVPALCTFGKNLSRSQVRLLQAHKIDNLYLGYDADAHKDIIKTTNRLKHLFHVHVIEFSPVEGFPKADPGDVLSGKIPVSWLTDSFKNSIDSLDSSYWEWVFKKEMDG